MPMNLLIYLYPQSLAHSQLVPKIQMMKKLASKLHCNILVLYNITFIIYFFRNLIYFCWPVLHYNIEIVSMISTGHQPNLERPKHFPNPLREHKNDLFWPSPCKLAPSPHAQRTLVWCWAQSCHAVVLEVCRWKDVMHLSQTECRQTHGPGQDCIDLWVRGEKLQEMSRDREENQRVGGVGGGCVNIVLTD